MNEQLKQQLHLQLQQMLESLLAQIAAQTSDVQVVELDQSRLGRLSRIDALQGQQMELETARRKQLRIPAKLNSHSGQREHPDP
ncbi:hypothetical protein [Aeromonas sp. ASNIH3]|uniref:hypothetical protein n=1 Tax=Aeromonas sp. ASNIH3 TaxID=1636608 RepID=UPI001F280106|nr:hypothetical protein [Aeromonas sp. ASNIH3]